MPRSVWPVDWRAARLTGEGCYLDVSCADAVIAAKWLGALAMLNPELVDRDWTGGGTGGSAKYQHYETADGKFVLFCAIESKFWEPLVPRSGSGRPPR